MSGALKLSPPGVLCFVPLIYNVGRCSSVDRVTLYGLDGPGIELRVWIPPGLKIFLLYVLSEGKKAKCRTVKKNTQKRIRWSKNRVQENILKNPGGGQIFRNRPFWPWGPPGLFQNGCRGIPEGKAAGDCRWPPTTIWLRGYRKSPAGCIFSLWACMLCSKLHFTFTCTLSIKILGFLFVTLCKWVYTWQQFAEIVAVYRCGVVWTYFDYPEDGSSKILLYTDTYIHTNTASCARKRNSSNIFEPQYNFCIKRV